MKWLSSTTKETYGINRERKKNSTKRKKDSWLFIWIKNSIRFLSHTIDPNKLKVDLGAKYTHIHVYTHIHTDIYAYTYIHTHKHIHIFFKEKNNKTKT